MVFNTTLFIICGFTFIIPHINGKQLRFSNDNGTLIKHGLVKVIPGFGMIRESNTGNLCIKFNIKYPDKLTSEQIEELKKIL